jgi:2-polyprenyl-3-methyl-5-hydroxy-6-metoxy-1,4-benzoquinol methylase
MINLKYRHNTKELLDADDIPFADIKQNLKELNTINTLLGGHKISQVGLKYFFNNNEALHVCEIGCGGGDNIKALSNLNTNNTFTGIDLKDTCLLFAQEQYGPLANWVCSDYSKVNFGANPDVIFSSLFCHHFTNDELVYMLQWKMQHCTKGFFINDLQRNTVAYYLIKWLTKFFSKSYLVKNDAPLSVARGFHKSEWIYLLEKAGIKNYTIKWKWAFRYLIVCKK